MTVGMSTLQRAQPGRGTWDIRYVVLLLALLALALLGARNFDEYVFNPVTQTAMVSLLTPLFVIALFVERAQEVFISAWREPGKQAIQAHINAGTAVDSPRAGGTTHDVYPAPTPQSPEGLLLEYKARTQRIAFMSSLAAGVVISIAGVRSIHPLVNWDADLAGAQEVVFDTVDIFVTGALLAGGSEGIHRLMSVITDFLDFTRGKIKRAQ